MLAIIEASFGDFTLFDESVRKALKKGVKTFSFHEIKMGGDARRTRGTSILDEDLSDVVSEESSVSQRFAARRPPGVRKKSSREPSEFPPSSTPRGKVVSAVQEETRTSWTSTAAPPDDTPPVAAPRSVLQLLAQQHAAGGCRVEYEAADERV